MENYRRNSIRNSANAWNSQLVRADKLFDDLTDEQLSQTSGINRNRGIYLLGHLTAI